MKDKKILITGGAGFIGTNLIRRLLIETNYVIYNIDKLGYASNLNNFNDLENNKHKLINKKIDLADYLKTVQAVFEASPDFIIHLAAESHVDRSIDKPINFVESNIIGTFNILEASREFYNTLSNERKESFRFLHVSTDEVFGSLGFKGSFDEKTPYSPRSPYSATKAASDHLVNAWNHTYKIPTIISNCSNNFGPYQFPEKLIPLTIFKAINGEDIPIYGDGNHIRDWLFVEDHVDALLLILEKGEIGKSYCVGGICERRNKDIVNLICKLLQKYKPKSKPYYKQITFVKDRPGHDRRYAINPKKIKSLGWMPKSTFEVSLDYTIKWYLENIDWLEELILKSKYSGERLGN